MSMLILGAFQKVMGLSWMTMVTTIPQSRKVLTSTERRYALAWRSSKIRPETQNKVVAYSLRILSLSHKFMICIIIYVHTYM